jgi:two-component system, sensor histidine kinase and response regulator
MDNSSEFIFRQTVSNDVYEQLCSFWHQMAQEESEAVLLTEEALFLASARLREKGWQKRFCLLFSPQFKVLLSGRLRTEDLFYQVTITWECEAIAKFLQQLNEEVERLQDATEDLRSQIKRFQQSLSDGNGSDLKLQNQFYLGLLDIFSTERAQIPNAIRTHVSLCKPVEDALRQQVAQERLLNQTIGQIRQSLDLSVILETAVIEVRNFLQVDRLVVYQFTNEEAQSENDSSHGWGRVTYESLASDNIVSVLNMTAEDDCFTYIPRYKEKYRRGLVVAIEDIEQAYSSSFCLMEVLRQRDIKAKLVAPIVVEEKLWGLLIAHQCFTRRQWFENEKIFLRSIGEHLAVAIYQAQLYAQVQQQKNTFEQRVIERTQELRDILLAAQAANQAKTDFLGNMSHELRTPLTSVIGLSGTLLHWSKKGSALSLEKQQQYLQMIQDSGKQLLALLNEIIDFSLLEAGKLVLNIKEISLRKIARTTLKTLQIDAANRQISLELDFRVEEDSDRFYADGDRVQQILFHLLVNAIKFTPAQGKVILRVWKENRYAVFQVEDTGIGISKKQLPLLFEKFQQLEKSRQRTHGGTGLGLALTKQLVELHRGIIDVNSTLGKGSLFTVRLPALSNRQLKTTPAVDTDEKATKEGKSIVLLEKDEELAMLICELLTAANYHIVWLMDSVTAIANIELLQPAIIIVNRHSPDVYLISQSLKNSPKTRSIKILLLSDRITSKEWKSLSQKGIDDYLVKPIQPHLLLQRISALVAQEKNLARDESEVTQGDRLE